MAAPTRLRAGWYADPVEIGTLRFFDGRRWTGRRLPSPLATPPPPVPPAGWYPDPYDPDHLRFWSGERWTEHRRAAEAGAPPPPPPPSGWYPDPDDPRSVRFWEAGRWTDRRVPVARDGSAPADDRPTGPVDGAPPGDPDPAASRPPVTERPVAADRAPRRQRLHRRRWTPSAPRSSSEAVATEAVAALSDLTSDRRAAEAHTPPPVTREPGVLQPATVSADPAETTPEPAAAAPPRRVPARLAAEVSTAAAWLRAILVASIAVAVVGFLTAAVAMVLSRSYFAGTRSLAATLAADDRLAWVAVALLLVDGAVAGLWLGWQRRAHLVVASVRPEALRCSVGWVTGAWLVPGLNLVRPVRMIDDLWQGTRGETDRPTSSPLVRAWWSAVLLTVAAFVLEEVLHAIALETLQSAPAWDRYYLAMMLLFVVHGVGTSLAFRLVGRLTARVRARLEVHVPARVDAQPGEPSAP